MAGENRNVCNKIDKISCMLNEVIITLMKHCICNIDDENIKFKDTNKTRRKQQLFIRTINTQKKTKT